MLARLVSRRLFAAVALMSVLSLAAESFASELLISDRLSNRILRYSASGSFLGVLTDDTAYLSEPNGMAVIGSTLYVANRQNNSVVGFSYDGYTATNPPIVVNTGLNVPASILIQDSGEAAKMYISNLGAAFDGATVTQLFLDGAPAGDDLTGGLPVGRSGLAFAPDGSLLVSSFQDGEILKYNSEAGAFESFIGSGGMLFGAGNMIVDGNSLYVTYGFSGAVMKYDATTGQPDPGFTPITNLVFPASISLAPDGNGILIGVLGLGGDGSIERYGFDGTHLGRFAAAGPDLNLGFQEATGMLVVESPSGALGDTDGDGDVDLDDLNNVRNHFGAEGPADGSLDGDSFPFDGVVDLDDLNGVRNNFGEAPASVPEPSSAALVMVALAAAGWWVRRGL